MGEAEVAVDAAAVEGRDGVSGDAGKIGGGGGGSVAVVGEDGDGGTAETFARSSFRCSHHLRTSCGQRNMSCAKIHEMALAKKRRNESRRMKQPARWAAQRSKRSRAKAASTINVQYLQDLLVLLPALGIRK